MSNQLDQRIRQLMQNVVDESPLPLEVPAPRHAAPIPRRQIPNWVAALVPAVILLVVLGGTAVFLGTDNAGSDDVATTQPTVTPAVSGVGDGQTVSVTVSGVSGHVGDDFAAVLYQGGELTNLDSDALGGFWWVIPDNNAATTETIRTPDDAPTGRFPYVSAEALTVEPGTYTLVLWVDDGLSPVTRWVPINSDAMGLYGCHVTFEVGTATQTDVTVTANLHPNGWNTHCTTGATIPGTNSTDAVTPPWPSPTSEL